MVGVLCRNESPLQSLCQYRTAYFCLKGFMFTGAEFLFLLFFFLFTVFIQSDNDDRNAKTQDQMYRGSLLLFYQSCSGVWHLDQLINTYQRLKKIIACEL